MININLTQEKFIKNHEIIDESSHLDDSLEGFEEVIIWVKPNSLAEVLDQFQNSSKELNSDGSMTFTISVYRPLQAGWLKSILLSFGSGAKIIKPVELQSILIEEAKKIIKVYKDV